MDQQQYTRLKKIATGILKAVEPFFSLSDILKWKDAKSRSMAQLQNPLLICTSAVCI